MYSGWRLAGVDYLPPMAGHRRWATSRGWGAVARAVLASAVLASAVLASAALTSSALAQEPPDDALARGLAAYAADDFDSARSAFSEALSAPRRTLAVSLEAHRHLAALRVRGGALDAAREHARMAVAIDPSVQPPEGSPPEVARLLRASRLERDRFLQIEAPREPEPGDVVHAYSRVVPEELAAALHLQCGDAVASGADVAVHLRLPAATGPTVECHASLNSLLGGPAFLRSRSTLTYFAEPPPPDQTSDDTALIWGLVAGGVGVAIVIASIAIGVAVSGGAAPEPDP